MSPFAGLSTIFKLWLSGGHWSIFRHIGPKWSMTEEKMFRGNNSGYVWITLPCHSYSTVVTDKGCRSTRLYVPGRPTDRSYMPPDQSEFCSIFRLYNTIVNPFLKRFSTLCILYYAKQDEGVHLKCFLHCELRWTANFFLHLLRWSCKAFAMNWIQALIRKRSGTIWRGLATP